MLVLASELTDKILKLQKTQLRRIVQPGQAGARPRCRFVPGAPEVLARKLRRSEMTAQEQVAVDRHEGAWPSKVVGTIEIGAIRRERLGDIAPEDARREGWRSPTLFKRDWVHRHSARWIGNRPDITNAQIEARFDTRWADTEVWVITFAVISHELLLAADPRRSGDYVISPFDVRGERVAMADERNAVDPALIDQWTGDSTSTHGKIKAGIAARRDTGADQRELDRHLLSVEDRAVRAHRAARLSSINVTSELRAFQDAQAKGKDTKTLEARLRAVEAKAYRLPHEDQETAA